jgi:hypothetical protein
MESPKEEQRSHASGARALRDDAPAAAPCPPPKEAVLVEAHAGVRYAWGFLPARAILLLLSVVNVLGMPYQLLMPEAKYLGAPQMVQVGDVGYLFGAVVFTRYLPTLRAVVSPSYIKMGLMQNTAV